MTDTVDRIPIYVVGYVKSGNTWTARLLGDALDSPIISGKDRPSLADEGFARKGSYIIRQLHLPHKKRPNDGKIVFVVRDPRDVAVSIKYYWQRDNLMSVIKGMAGGKGKAPMQYSGGWIKFMSSWLEDGDFDAMVRYESLINNTKVTLKSSLVLMGLDPVKPLDEVVERQSFANRKANITKQLPYGDEIQHRLMRKGVVGDWKNHFTCEHAQYMHDHFFELMEHLGYEDNENWWKDVCNN